MLLTFYIFTKGASMFKLIFFRIMEVISIVGFGFLLAIGVNNPDIRIRFLYFIIDMILMFTTLCFEVEAEDIKRDLHRDKEKISGAREENTHYNEELYYMKGVHHGQHQ